MSVLHDAALNAQTALEKLATELAHAGVDKPTVAAVSQMATLTRKLVVQIAASEQGQGQQPPPDVPASGQPVQEQPHTMDSAINSLTPSGGAGGGR